MREFDDRRGSGAVGWALRRVVMWGGLGLLGYFAAASRLPSIHADADPSAKSGSGKIGMAAGPPRSAAVSNALVFRADRRGHILLDAVVNGAPVRFLLDTGATVVALTPADAAAAGIGAGELRYTAAAETANGRVRMAPVTLREIRVEQLAVDDVSAAVVERLDTSLLGMSFLSRLQSYEMRDGVLTINW